MQRMYGTAFWTEAELDAHLKWLEDVKERDHRRLGTDLDLFSTHGDVGGGFIFWHPNLGAVRRAIEEFWWEEHTAPRLRSRCTRRTSRAKTLFAVSGHLENYADMMYAPMEIEEQPYRVKPMNCPGHIMIYKTRGHSYRELPLRWAELGTVYRYERSGRLARHAARARLHAGRRAHLLHARAARRRDRRRVRARAQDPVDLRLRVHGVSRDAAGEVDRRARGLGAGERSRCGSGRRDAGLPFELDEGGGAFYGPKIDFKIKDALGREWQNSTIQVRLQLARALRPARTPTPTASRSGRSWCTARSSAAWSASSAA